MGEQYILHLIPSGILNPQTICLIGNGVVIDPQALLTEMTFLEDKKISVANRLFISDRAHLIFPYHKQIDKLRESDSQGQKIGTTGRGIGPAYADKVNRCGIRVSELMDQKSFIKKLRSRIHAISPCPPGILSAPRCPILPSMRSAGRAAKGSALRCPGCGEVLWHSRPRLCIPLTTYPAEGTCLAGKRAGSGTFLQEYLAAHSTSGGT